MAELALDRILFEVLFTCTKLWFVTQIPAMVDSVAVFVQRQAKSASFAGEFGYFARAYQRDEI